MKEVRCLACYELLVEGEKDFHARCSRRLFGSAQPPQLDLDLSQLEAAANRIIAAREVLTGVQPKLSLHLEQQRGTPARFIIMGLHGDYILKPPSPQYPELPQNEDLTMHLAALSGISVAGHSLIRLSLGELAYLTKRFDRHKGAKMAVEDFCQLSGNLTEHKYRSSLEKAGKITRQFCANSGLEAIRLFELLLFCFLTGNADMHLKNFSLLEGENGEYGLAPAYDLLSTTLALPEDKEESALTLNGKKAKIQKADFDALANTLKLPEKTIARIYTRFQNLEPKWKTLIGKSFLSSALQEAYGALIRQKMQCLFGN